MHHLAKSEGTQVEGTFQVLYLKVHDAGLAAQVGYITRAYVVRGLIA